MIGSFSATYIATYVANTLYTYVQIDLHFLLQGQVLRRTFQVFTHKNYRKALRNVNFIMYVAVMFADQDLIYKRDRHFASNVARRKIFCCKK